MSKLAHSNQEFMDELDRLRFEDDDSFMYADWDLPEENAKARHVVAMIERGDKLADCAAAFMIAALALVALYAVDVQPGKMLGMFAGPQLTVEVPTIYADPKSYKRKP